jgi:acyl-CoA thioester hydrolase
LTWHEWPVRVYYEDTDAEGVVYYANYLRFMERGRTEWLRDLGIEQDALRDRYGLCFVVAETQVRFREPARFNDQLVVRSRMLECRRARFELEQNVHLAADSTLLVASYCKAACVDAHTFRPRRLPDVLRSAMAMEEP